jgi:hypothetical protein
VEDAELALRRVARVVDERVGEEVRDVAVDRVLGIDVRGLARALAARDRLVGLAVRGLERVQVAATLDAVDAAAGAERVAAVLAATVARTEVWDRLPATPRLGARAEVGSASMIRLLRLALQVVLFFLLLSLVVAVASAETGTVEKGVLIAVGCVLVWLASRVRRIGAPVRAS